MNPTTTISSAVLGAALAGLCAMALVACGNDAPDAVPTSQSATTVPTTIVPATRSSTVPATTMPSPTVPATTANGVVVPIDPGDGGVYEPAIDPADFVDVVDHPYFPLAVGSRWVYEGEDNGEVERIEVVVTDQRRDILGVSAVVVRDTVTIDGEVIEDTFDWFAQDHHGNVWYLGEDTREFENGVAVNAKGAWEAGIDGAQPGIVMLAAPAVGDAYRQELYVGEAEDMARVVRVGEAMQVPAGAYSDVLVTEDWTPLEPDVLEEKSYAPGVGLIAERKISGDAGRVELIEFTPGE